MKQTLFFYDLETSGVNPREQRVMQFAGQRTDLELNPIEEPFNIILALADDVLPEPDAILITGITPQQSKSEGLTEAEFLRIFHSKIAKPGTIFVGYNTVRFDDEFMRYLHYRNFYDAYEWHWQDGKSRWDLLDMVRMTRALRPDGIKWPVGSDGRATNRLELLTNLNRLDHNNAHDALSDVLATIAVAKLIRSKQPKLFDYLLDMRDKNKVEALVTSGKPFVYASGKYPSETEKTTIALFLCENPKTGALVYDLRHDPTPWLKMSPAKLVDAWRYKKDVEEPRLPVKTLQYNRCPAVSPTTVLDDASKKRLRLDMVLVEKHQAIVKANPDFCNAVQKAVEILNKEQQTAWLTDEKLVDGQLYDGFIGGQDKQLMHVVRAADESTVKSLDVKFKDTRLNALLPLYKARNFPGELSSEEREQWESFRYKKLLSNKPSRAERYFARLGELAQNSKLPAEKQYLLEELQLYGASILPEPI